ncbi:WD40 repeat domain-containing protein [Candidatus Sulfurimonas baltica]|uniref:WD40 repeat domain-containing protein n=1 Tax=Candidatus Sulfurimonas baltica TaxID=2740404 RepID=A0A7S7LXH9_9BACT|nr:WD40 repeat domain-containing protein [Candidatus Sulfurimonas baltica]QOY53236.1 WD40 repeat domain-containing protein [Candidatus Sulfurimonas baltica]
MEKIYFNDNDKEKMRIKLSNNWEVNYDGELYLREAGDFEPKELVGHSEKVIGLLNLDGGEFLSISKDNTMIVWSAKGRKQATFESENSIVGISKIGDGKILALLEDESVVLWSVKYRRKLATFDLKVSSFDDVELDQSYLSFITKDGDLKVYTDTGNSVITFQNQKTFFTAWRFLRNDYCLTRTSTEIIELWSSSGEKVATINDKFSFSKDFLTIDEKSFAFVNENNEICIYDFEGKKYSSSKVDLANLTRTFIQTKEKLENQKKQNNIMDFMHVNNPDYKEVFIPSEVILKNDIELQDDDTKYLWNFFNRPIFNQIHNLLKKEEKSVKEYRKKMHEIKENEMKLDEVNLLIASTIKIKKIIAILVSLSFFSFALIVAGMLYKVLPSNMPVLVLVPFVLFVVFIMIWKSKFSKLLLLHRKKEKINTIDMLMQATKQWLKSVVEYRDSIIKQIPVLKDQNLYSGLKAKEIIKSKINNEIEKLALEECGITKDDIEFTDITGANNREAIVLHDWSKIQDKTNDSMSKKITSHNEMSFWSTKDGDILFAVQYIQFIFLTKDKIDVFNTYYDFIKNEYISKQSHAYYYKDVTNMSKKQVERIVFSESDEYSATEISLQVSSGDKINLTIINPETMKNLKNQFSSDEDLEERGLQIKELEEKLEEIKSDDSLDEDEKQDEIEMIEGQINSRKNDTIIVNKVASQELNKADQTIQNIRAQVRNHKTIEDNT